METENKNPKNLKQRHPKIHYLAWALFASVVALLLVSSIGPGFVMISSNQYTKSEEDMADLPPREVALVLGASLRVDKTPTLFLQARLETAAELYKQGKVKKVLLSGDNETNDYDEPIAMQRAIIELGVPESDTTRDPGGLDTYDSCYRARHIFGVGSAYIVTQGYHAPRAAHTCRRLGIDAVAIGTSRYWDRYGRSVMPDYMFREIFSINKSLIELYITKPPAALTGEKSPINP